MFVSVLLVSALALIPAQNVGAYLGDRILNQGTSGYDVVQLQNNLDYLGYEVGFVDGIYGWRTAAAVKDFQTNNKLEVNGVVNKDAADIIISQVSHEPTAKPVLPCNPGFSSKDIYDLARVVHGEARGEHFTGQVAIAAVVLNRLNCENFGQTIQEIIHEHGAFTAVDDGQYYMEPDPSAFAAVEAAIEGWDPTGGAIYYWNPQTATNKWVWSRTIINQIGKHVFAL
ncbi:MAG TPA: cell wall hydrolase [Syntrophomonadaceae bacterium]|nr:cell wall hydrolase [Syntrophomonadaceae bacterium]